MPKSKAKSIRVGFYIPLVLIACLWGLTARAGNFFSDPFERLDSGELRAALQNEKILARLFLVEALKLEEKIHASRLELRLLAGDCEIFQRDDFSQLPAAEKGDAALACAIAFTENGGDVRQIFALLSRARGFKTNPLHQLYAEGRIYAHLPPGGGQNFGKSLIALEMLRRMDPRPSSPSFWLGRVYQLQGNRDKARENYVRARAFTPSDRRTAYFFDGEDFVDEPTALDGLRYGWTPQLIASPGRGFGASVVLFDDRLWDTRRSGELGLSGATRGNFAASLSLVDGELLNAVGLELSGDFYLGNEDFFGVGPATTPAMRQSLEVQKSHAQLSARVFLIPHLSFALGWRVMQAQLREGFVGALPDAAGITVSGAIGEIRYDDRDSRRRARHGYVALLRGFFPTRDLGSPRTFEVWESELQGNWALGLRHEFGIRATGRLTRGEVPFAAYSRLSSIPGVREGRLFDRAVVAVSPEYGMRITGPLRGSVFAVAATAADDLTSLGKSTWRLGGGGALTYFFTPYRAPFARLEVAYFGDEFIYQVAGGVSF